MSKTIVPLLTKVVPDAFHGTELSKAREIERTRRFTPSTGSENLYLGDGVYFYEGSLEYARDWAETRFQGQEVGVLQANIQLGRCLDLNNQKAVELIQWVGKKILELAPDRPLKDAAIINWLSKNSHVDTVRATFPNSSGGKKIFSGSHFFFSQLVICVVNHGCIKRISLAYRSPKPGEQP